MPLARQESLDYLETLSKSPSSASVEHNTHNARLTANGVTLSDYVLGMLLLGALPSKWDHVAAIYLQGKTAHTDISYTEVRNAIIAELDRKSVV